MPAGTAVGQRRRISRMRAEGAQRRIRHRRAGAMARGNQRRAQRAHDQATHDPGVAKPHLGLGRMDVDVDHVGRRLEEQRHHRVAVARQEVLVSAAHRAVQQLVAHRTAVDEKILVLRRRPVERRQARETREPEALAIGVDGQAVVGEVAAHHGAEPRQPRRIALLQQRRNGRRQVDQGALFALEAKGDGGMRHGKAAHGVGDVARLGARLLQELEPRRRGEEKIANLDPRAGGRGGGHRLGLGAAVDREAPGRVGDRRSRSDGKAAHRGDRRQGLAAETQRCECRKDRRRGASTCNGARRQAADRQASCRCRRRPRRGRCGRPPSRSRRCAAHRHRSHSRPAPSRRWPAARRLRRRRSG